MRTASDAANERVEEPNHRARKRIVYGQDQTIRHSADRPFRATSGKSRLQIAKETDRKSQRRLEQLDPCEKKTQPQPGYAIGFRREAFTKDKLSRSSPWSTSSQTLLIAWPSTRARSGVMHDAYRVNSGRQYVYY